MADRTDVLIIGGGPAGLAAAIAARQRGFRVTVVEAAGPPIDKACGEGLMPDTVAALAQLGVTFGPGDGHVLRGIRFIDSGVSLEADFPVGLGIGVRRTTLHGRMIDRAASCGVSLLWQSRATRLRSEGADVDGRPVRADWIIGADGANSLVRRWAGLAPAVRNQQRFCYRRHYRARPWTDWTEIYWGEGSQIYVTPVGPEEMCVAVISRDSNLRLDKALHGFPELVARLASAEPTSTEKGAVTTTLRLRSVYRGRVALVGDASGCVDAITGEGLGLGFRQAAALGDALVSGNLARYESAHRRFAQRPTLMARLLLALGARVSLRRRMTRAFAREPRLFAQMLAAHVGAASPHELAAAGLLLGWRLLTA